MILKASQRSNAAQLAAHLLNANDNERIEVHEVSGFIANNIPGAFKEAEAVAKGTRCSQFLFSMSLSPPAHERADIAAYEDAIARAEERLQLSGHPRVIVFHEKEGRRHAHAVWSRIDSQQMKAVNMAFYKEKLTGLSRELYLEHGWQMPNGLIDRKQRNPLNFTLAEWQQAKRLKQSPQEIKTTLKECWTTTDSKAGFTAALERKGYALAQGDRRGYVAVDWQGEVYSLSRWLNQKYPTLQSRLGERMALPTVDKVKEKHTQTLLASIRKGMEQIEQKYQPRLTPLKQQKQDMIAQHQGERDRMKTKQDERWQQEVAQRQARLSKGLKGLWQRLTGRHQTLQQQNDLSTLHAFKRDQQQRDDLIYAQLQERQTLQNKLNTLHQQQQQEVAAFKDTLFAHVPEQSQQPVRDLFAQIEQKRKYRSQHPIISLDL
tara:strand:+ start:2406 stop:3704 length:1299 start_codon:yes stop_codon:yes gene_type:complete